MNTNFKYRQISFPATVVCYTAVDLSRHAAQADYLQGKCLGNRPVVKLPRYKNHTILIMIAFRSCSTILD